MSVSINTTDAAVAVLAAVAGATLVSKARRAGRMFASGAAHSVLLLLLGAVITVAHVSSLGVPAAWAPIVAPTLISSLSVALVYVLTRQQTGLALKDPTVTGTRLLATFAEFGLGATAAAAAARAVGFGNGVGAAATSLVTSPVVAAAIVHGVSTAFLSALALAVTMLAHASARGMSFGARIPLIHEIGRAAISSGAWALVTQKMPAEVAEGLASSGIDGVPGGAMTLVRLQTVLVTLVVYLWSFRGASGKIKVN